MLAEYIWKTAATFDPEAFFQGLGRHFEVQVQRERLRRGTLLDTFDWSLYREGSVLVWESGMLSLRTIDPPKVLDRVPRDQPPDFPDRMEPGPIQTRLLTLTDLRAFLPLVKYVRTSQEVLILNQARKTTVRCFRERYWLGERRSGPPWSEWLRVVPVRGYESRFEEVRQIIESLGVGEPVTDIYTPMLATTGRQPGAYRPKFTGKLNGDAAAAESLNALMLHFLAIMHENLAGTIADWDSEFLHDYRVAIRRIRTALGQMRRVLEPTTAQRARRDFANLGRRTGLMRDLDVFLLGESEFKARLPADMRLDLDPFFEDLRQKRVKARQGLVRHLRSKTLDRTMTRWLQEFSGPADIGEGAEWASWSTRVMAAKVIGRRYRRVLKKGRAIDDTSPDEALHELRIDCKKLRYLLEFFISLFPAKKMAKLIKELKMLQDLLGRFNDLSVQRATFRAYVAEDAGGDRIPVRALVAIGYMLAELRREQLSLRAHFAETFERFADERNQRLAAKLTETC